MPEGLSAEEQLVEFEKEVVKVRALSTRVGAILGTLEKEVTAEWLRIRDLVREKERQKGW
jgi:hypothetical protein